jgi:uncharacterized protein YjiS (DUF1127 family)
MSRKALTLTVTIPLPARGDLAAALRRVPGAAWRGLLRWQARATERTALLAMDERMRRDMGIDYETWLREAYKPFWRP